jgi:hypothetical protein
LLGRRFDRIEDIQRSFGREGQRGSCPVLAFRGVLTVRFRVNCIGAQQKILGPDAPASQNSHWVCNPGNECLQLPAWHDRRCQPAPRLASPTPRSLHAPLQRIPSRPCAAPARGRPWSGEVLHSCSLWTVQGIAGTWLASQEQEDPIKNLCTPGPAPRSGGRIHSDPEGRRTVAPAESSRPGAAARASFQAR